MFRKYGTFGANMKNYNIDDYRDGEIVSSDELQLEKPEFGWKFIEGERASHYTLVGVLSELIDNSIDSDADNIDITLVSDGDDKLIKITIKDDGNGMNQEELSGSFRIGASINKVYSNKSIGKFGRGGTLGCISVAKEKKTFTCKDGITLGKGYDLDIVKEKDCWVVYNLDVPQKIRSLLGGTGGTLIELSELDRLENDSLTYVKGELIQRLSQVYNPFLQSEGNITVNGTKVVAWDPLRLNHPETKLWLDDCIMHKDAEGIEHPVYLKAVYLEDVPKEDKLIQTGVTKNNKPKYETLHQTQGGYFYRSGRIMHEGAKTNANGLKGFFDKHGNFRNFRFSVEYGPALDIPFGTLKSKDGFKMNQSLSNKIAQKLKPYWVRAEEENKGSETKDNRDNVKKILKNLESNLNTQKRMSPKVKKGSPLSHSSASVSSRNTRGSTSSSPSSSKRLYCIEEVNWSTVGPIGKITPGSNSDDYEWKLEVNEAHPVAVSFSGYDKKFQKPFYDILAAGLVSTYFLDDDDREEFINTWSIKLSRFTNMH